jgi:hypothetical protein
MDGTERIRPSAWYYLLAVGCFVGALGITILLFAAGMRRVRDAMVREDIPGQMDLELKRDETYTVFLEQTAGANPGSSAGPAFLVPHCEVNALSNGEKISARRPAAAGYLYRVRAGVPMMEFSVPHDGTYMIACTDDRTNKVPKMEVAVGGGAAKAISTVVARSFFVMAGGIVVGLLIIVRVTALRLASRKEIRERGLKPV